MICSRPVFSAAVPLKEGLNTVLVWPGPCCHASGASYVQYEDRDWISPLRRSRPGLSLASDGRVPGQR